MVVFGTSRIKFLRFESFRAFQRLHVKKSIVFEHECPLFTFGNCTSNKIIKIKGPLMSVSEISIISHGLPGLTPFAKEDQYKVP